MAKVKLVNSKWHCYSPDGKDMCAFLLQKHAVEVAVAHGWNHVVE